MATPRRRTLAPKNPPPPAPEAPRPVAVLDLGASAVRLVVAEAPPGQPIRILEEASRGVLLGKDTFTNGKLGRAATEATLKALEGFRRLMDTYGVVRYRAVATSAIREAQNRDAFLDRVRLRTGIDVEIIDGTEENRLTYMAVRETLGQRAALLLRDTLLVEVGGGSADISFLRKGQPIHSGTYPLGSVRMRQSLASWQGTQEQGTRLLRRHIHNVVDDIRREMPLREAKNFIALGGDVRFAVEQMQPAHDGDDLPVLPREPFLSFVDQISSNDVEQLIEQYRLHQADAETLVPALLAYRELVIETGAEGVIVPNASLRAGLLLDITQGETGQGFEDFSRQVLSSAAALGEKYRYDAPHARTVASLAVSLFDQLKAEHGLGQRERVLLEVAALLHDVGNYVNLRGHHKHTWYLLSVSEIFGLGQDDMALVANVARYHRRALPQKSHLPYMALDREARVVVNKLSAILRLANALDADHLQKVKDVKVIAEEDGDWVLEVDGGGDLTMERLASLARSDFLTEVFGRRVSLPRDEGAGVTPKVPPKARKKEPELFINRELSWLEFNHRVFEEAADPTVPLLDRLKFAIIVSTNLDEFFMVRVARLQRAIEEGDTAPDVAGLRPRQQLEAVSVRAHEMADALGRTLSDEILPGLGEHGVRLSPLADLEEAQRMGLVRHFQAEVSPALTPLAIDVSRPFPRLSNLSLNLAVLLAPGEGETEPRLAMVQVPSGLRRLVRPTGVEGSIYVLLEEIVRAELASLFPGQTVLEAAAFRVARDAELELDDEGGRPYLEAIEEELRKRRTGQVIRLEVEAGIGDAVLQKLMTSLEVEASSVYRVKGLLDMRGLWPLVELPALEHLREAIPKPLVTVSEEDQKDPFARLAQGDILLHQPYESFEPVIAFVSAAASDPDVLAIKQTLYRTSGESPIVRALARAADAGKQVTVLVELMARFDEQSNIRWARRLEEAGAHVIYGIRGFKTHAKICLVVRRGRHGIERYVHLGTGNYNERTARLYTDFGLMTADPVIGEDASAFFNALTGYSDPPRLKRLAMAPTGLRERVLKLIERERRRAEEGQAAEIRAKMNALVDEEMIRALYDASRAGVRVRLNVRGVCCLRPGLKGVSDTIEVVSIVDRFLEHARIFYFRNGGDEEVYLGSADWMPRNLDRRIELLFPVSPACRRKVMDALDAMFLDNVKARRLQPDGTYRRKRPGKGEEPFRAQVRLYEDARRTLEKARAASGVVLEPIATVPKG